MTVELSPISDADVPEVAGFLHRHLNRRVSRGVWADALQAPWKADAPNHGFLLRDDGEVVGACLAFYSERTVRGRPERFCNLGAWSVLPSHRFHSLRLLKALLAQDGYHHTDLSPSGPVVALNERLGFRHLDTSSALVPNLPWPAVPGGGTATCDPVRVERGLSGPDLELYRDHSRALAARHLLVRRGGRAGYLMVRRVRRKNLPLFAAVLYAGDRSVVGRCWPAISRHLLVHHGIPFTLAERRIVGDPPGWSVPLRSARPKMFRSPSLEAADIDDLYSELTCVPW
jgi:hypothetical protein